MSRNDDQLLQLANRKGFVLDIQTERGVTEQLADKLFGLECSIVIDHRGRPDPAEGPERPGFQ